MNEFSTFLDYAAYLSVFKRTI